MLYTALCEPVRLALGDFGLTARYGEVPGSYCDGRFNLNVQGLKVTGTALRIAFAPENPRGVQSGVMAQAMIMIEADAGALTEVVNTFYREAGGERQFDPAVSAAVADFLPAEAPGVRTKQFREALWAQFHRLAGSGDS